MGVRGGGKWLDQGWEGEGAIARRATRATGIEWRGARGGWRRGRGDVPAFGNVYKARQSTVLSLPSHLASAVRDPTFGGGRLSGEATIREQQVSSARGNLPVPHDWINQLAQGLLAGRRALCPPGGSTGTHLLLLRRLNQALSVSGGFYNVLHPDAITSRADSFVPLSSSHFVLVSGVGFMESKDRGNRPQHSQDLPLLPLNLTNTRCARIPPLLKWISCWHVCMPQQLGPVPFVSPFSLK